MDGVGSRYDRQIALPGFGLASQRRLRQANVLVVGAGGLGSPAIAYLAGAGCNLTIVDSDVVGRHNLHRQVLYKDSDVGLPKAELAAEFARRLNPDVAARPVVQRLTGDTVESLVTGVGVVLDCSDNLPTRYLLNRACFEAGVPYVWAAIGGTAGRCSAVVGGSPCFECVMGPLVAGTVGTVPTVPATFGPTCGMLGSLMAGQAVAVLAGVGNTLAGRLANIDLVTGEMAVIDTRHDPFCTTCGHPSCAK